MPGCSSSLVCQQCVMFNLIFAVEVCIALSSGPSLWLHMWLSAAACCPAVLYKGLVHVCMAERPCGMQEPDKAQLSQEVYDKLAAKQAEKPVHVTLC